MGLSHQDDLQRIRQRDRRQRDLRPALAVVADAPRIVLEKEVAIGCDIGHTGAGAEPLPNGY